MAAKGTHLDARTTYLLKLGAKALGPGYSKLDRRISGSIAGTLVRLRVQDLATAQARCLAPLLASAPARPLQLLNIAGGPANDSLNTLLLLKRMVKKMIEEEDRAKPLTDEQITAMLQRQGIDVTRRTVAKYREDMKIPSTHQRRVRN